MFSIEMILKMVFFDSLLMQNKIQNKKLHLKVELNTKFSFKNHFVEN